MGRTVYVNGEYLDEADAKISIFDRGFLMADGVYEVTSILNGKMIDFDGHMVRLARSLSELEMPTPETNDEIETIHRELIRANGLIEGLVYLQVTRGAADRSFLFPEGVKSSLVMFTQVMNLMESPTAATGIKIISIPDIRWGRRDIKTIQLLAPSLGKMAAKAAGVDDAWLVEDGFVTEGTSNNAYIVQGGKIITRDLSQDILSGITRSAVLRFAREAQMDVVERPFTMTEAMEADEAFVTSATTFVTSVIEVVGPALGAGKPGLVARRLREIYLDESMKSGT